MSVWEKSFIKAKPLEKDIVIIILFFVLILIVAAQIYNSIIIGNVVKEITPDSNPAFWFSKAEKYENIGEDLFRLSMDEFERGNYFNASDLCKNARSNFKSANWNYLNVLSILKLKNDTDKDTIELININLNLTNINYERCEYFEAAFLNILNNNSERAFGNLGIVREKTFLHDDLVKLYNEKLVDSNQKLKEFLAIIEK